MMEPDELNSSQRIAKAVIGGVVVVLLILVGIGVINLIRSRFASVTPATPTKVTTTKTTTTTNMNTGSDTQQANTNYNAMPETGPKEIVIASMIALAVLGRSAIVLSKKLL